MLLFDSMNHLNKTKSLKSRESEGCLLKMKVMMMESVVSQSSVDQLSVSHQSVTD